MSPKGVKEGASQPLRPWEGCSLVWPDSQYFKSKEGDLYMKSSDLKILVTNSKKFKNTLWANTKLAKENKLEANSDHRPPICTLQPRWLLTPFQHQYSMPLLPTHSPCLPWSMSICPTVEINLVLEESAFNFSNDLPTAEMLSHLPSKGTLLIFAYLWSQL